MKNKNLIVLSFVYLFFMLIYWFRYSKTLFFPDIHLDNLLKKRIASLVLLWIFVVLGIFQEVIKHSIIPKKYYFIIDISGLLICIFFCFQSSLLLGIMSGVYTDFAVLSFYYGVFLLRQIVTIKK